MARRANIRKIKANEKDETDESEDEVCLLAFIF